MKKIGYILAAIYAVFSLSVTSFAGDLLEDAVDGAETVASDVGDALEDVVGGSEDDPAEADTSDDGDDPMESSDDPADDPEESSDISDTEPDVSASDDATTTAPTEVGNAGGTQNNPATGVVLGCTALGMAAAALTAAAARKRK